MDPQATLELIRRLAKRLQRECEDDSDPTIDPDDVLELATSILDLDEWLTNGGFQPNDWE